MAKEKFKSKTPENPNPKTFQTQSKYVFASDELTELGREAGRQQGEVQRLEAELASIKSDYKGKIEAAGMRRDTAFRKLADGFEMREVEAVAEFHQPEKGKKTLYKVDRNLPGWKGEQIRVEEMTQADFQMELLNENPPVPFDSIKEKPVTE